MRSRPRIPIPLVTTMLAPRRRPLLAALLGIWVAAAPGAAAPSLEPLFDQLEGLGLHLAYLRGLTARVAFQFTDDMRTFHLPFQGKDRSIQARYGGLGNQIFLLDELREGETDAFPTRGLGDHDMNSVLHELAHASFDLDAEQGGDGLAALALRGAHAEIVRDLEADPGQKLRLSQKADEVCGYLVGEAYGELFRVAEAIVRYNSTGPGGWSPAGEAFLLPPDPAGRAALGIPEEFGLIHVDGVASAPHGLFGQRMDRIGWRERDEVKRALFRGALGLVPPTTAEELVQRMNAAQGAWIEERRQRVRRARARIVAASGAIPASPEEGGAGLFGQ